MKSFVAPLLALLSAGCMTMDDGVPASRAPDDIGLALDIGGVRLVTLANGSTRPVIFGTSGAEATAAVSAAVSDRGRDSIFDYCGTNPMQQHSWPMGLTISISVESEFVGWDVSEPGLTLMNGVGVGTTRAALEEAHPVRVSQTRLGTEFWIGEEGAPDSLGGLLDGTGPNARVTKMWSGVNCAVINSR